MRVGRIDGILALFLLLTGCSGEPPFDPIGSESDPIVNGSLDTTHQAVVAWLHGSKCTATIIDVDVSSGIGHALTAAHCTGGSNGSIRQGNNHNSGYIAYPVIAQQEHPEYGQGPGLTEAYDVAVLTFSGATASTPVIPVLTPGQDNISSGTQLDLVGYGLTENGGTSLRHHVVKPVDSESDIFIYFDQSISGLCSGDSGGPSLANISGEKVAGVHSRAGNSSSACTGSNAIGVDIRASAFWSSFISPTINGQSSGSQTCDHCSEAHASGGWDGDCESQTLACFQNAACIDYVNCLDTCLNQLCVNQCKQQYPLGANLYDQISSCLCNTACVSECATAGFCNPPACGLSFNDDQCQSCLEQSCCAQVEACSTDAECLQCLSSPIAAGCDTDPETQALVACADAACPGQCEFNFGTGGGGAGMGGAGVGATGGAGASVGAGGGPVWTANEGEDDDDEVIQTCGCRVVGQPTGRAVWLLSALFGLAVVARRRWT